MTQVSSRPGAVARVFCGLLVLCAWLSGVAFALDSALGSAALVQPDEANPVTFPAREARFVRFVILATDGSSQPCVDELEVYGPDSETNVGLAADGAKATASSCLEGHAIHQIEHLNDGQYGNAYSWIAAGTGEEWGQIELPEPVAVDKVVFSRDRTGVYRDRTPVSFEVRLSLEGTEWETVAKAASKVAQVPRPGDIPNPPPPPRIDRDGAVMPAGVVADIEVGEEDELGFANLARDPKAKPAASSLLPGHAIHQVEHLNDGLAGNAHSWISNGDPSWAEIDLGAVYWMYKVAFASDATGALTDRAATAFAILTATEHNPDSGAPTWKAVYERPSGSPVRLREAFTFGPVAARWVRIVITAANIRTARIDEIEVFGQAGPIALDRIGPLTPPVTGQPAMDLMLLDAFLGEEHAWLKTYGRADISPRLVPYNGRVKEYPRHVGDDRAPLPPLSSAPVIDGNFDDACWQEASKGAVRVASTHNELMPAPLIVHELSAGWHGEDLFLALRTDKLLSSHVAVVSSGDWRGCGVVAYTDDGFVFNQYGQEQRKSVLVTSTPVEGAFSAGLERCELRLPLALFPRCRDKGLRVGLGMGGKHTDKLGRPIHFVFSPLALAQAGPCVDGTFSVRLAATSAGVTVRANAPGLEDGLTLGPGESKTLSIRAERGPIGLQFSLKVSEGDQVEYALHLFRYDPLVRTLALMGAMIDRFAGKGLTVEDERAELAALRQRHDALMTATAPDVGAARQAFVEARLAKRRLFFRERDLAPTERILFVKRRAFMPSHNYSTCFDAPFRSGGGICVLEVPRVEGRFKPEEATVTGLFDSGKGIARNPMANFDLSKVYFGYRASRSGYYHILAMGPDGGDLEQLTDGPFHDYWPCPLPDGGLAFITTRCICRALCWRPQAAVLYRMDADGGNIQALSWANLTEWAPSMMRDGRVIWTRWEYLDKGADFGHTLWSIRPDGSHPQLVFGNTIIQPNGYANGREVPGTNEICCTLISHFGDLNGPIALLDLDEGRFNPKAITSLTPEVPWPGAPPSEECFRDPVPLARDYFLCSHAPRDRFRLFVIDRYGNRELVYADPNISCMCPTPFRAVAAPPVLASALSPKGGEGEFILTDVYRGLSSTIERGRVKYIRVVEEVRSDLERLPNGEYRKDHPAFFNWYASPVDRVSGPHGWPTYVAKAPHGIAPVEADGSARFYAPAGKTLYFQALDADLNELQRMRSVVQLQPGEKRSCIGCHEGRRLAPPNHRELLANGPRKLDVAPWGGVPFSFEQVVQPVLDRHCVRCHDADHPMKLDFTGTLDGDKAPASYRTLIRQGLVHYADCGWNSGGFERLEPLTFGTVKSKLWDVLDAGHHDVQLTRDDVRRIKTWIDLNCPLWPDYTERPKRPSASDKVAKAE